ncbi:kinase-like domain-containing protein [Mucidula mucida]|nr:kinase-like domain-containing protein [Mucidula mucida]
MDDILHNNEELDTPSPIESSSSDLSTSDSSCSGLRVSNVPSPSVGPRTLSENRLLRYKWKRTVGAGSFGRVQLVRSLDDGHCCAIKTINKSRVVRQAKITHTNNEAAILSWIRDNGQCPFIIELSGIFQDTQNLYMVMEYVPGGELCTLLRDSGRFSENQARFYLSEVIVALVFLHDRRIMYRDLKTENILIGRNGHIKLADFGLANRSKYGSTPDYMAPEIIRGESYNHSVDYYSFGVLVYELLVGTTPYHIPSAHFPDAQARLDAIYKDILAGPQFIRWPPTDVVSPLAKILVTRLMCINSKRRLGSGERGTSDVLTHPWFKRVDWRAVQDGTSEPPYIPRLRGDDDTSAFNSHSNSDAYLFDPLRRGATERDEHGQHFKDFPYIGASPESAQSLR